MGQIAGCASVICYCCQLYKGTEAKFCHRNDNRQKHCLLPPQEVNFGKFLADFQIGLLISKFVERQVNNTGTPIVQELRKCVTIKQTYFLFSGSNIMRLDEARANKQFEES